jgi:beta-lactamase superfamily II metal-dependent hydrolase
MARRFLNKKGHRFFFTDSNGDEQSYKLIFGDEVNTLSGAGSKGPDYRRVRYRGRTGQWKPPPLSTKRSLELYALDVGQGDAAFVVTPNDTKILVDGGLKDRALGFLIWKYRLDDPGNEVTIDHLFLSHADKDHVEGLIPLLRHPRIHVTNIFHNGIGLFDSGFNTKLGTRTGDRLTTLHDTAQDLQGLALADGNGAVFKDWIDAVVAKGSNYRRLDRSDGVLDIGDPEVTCEIVGPVLESDGTSLKWMSSKSKTINGNSLVFRLTHGHVRAFFSGDLNEQGSEHLLEAPGASLMVNAHIFKSPHHGSHEFSTDLLAAVNPMITVVSSGESPDHGHPRANFLGVIGRFGRGAEPLLFSTELAALFVDEGDPQHVADAGTETELGGLNFHLSQANAEARMRFKKVLPGIINVRTDGTSMYAYRRVQQYYQWEAYGPITPLQ